MTPSSRSALNTSGTLCTATLFLTFFRVFSLCWHLCYISSFIPSKQVKARIWMKCNAVFITATAAWQWLSYVSVKWHVRVCTIMTASPKCALMCELQRGNELEPRGVYWQLLLSFKLYISVHYITISLWMYIYHLCLFRVCKAGNLLGKFSLTRCCMTQKDHTSPKKGPMCGTIPGRGMGKLYVSAVLLVAF